MAALHLLDSALPEWQCHKRVRAAQIEIIRDQHVPDGAILTLTGGFTVKVDAKWIDRHQARVGGYYVVYEDGYASYSPQAAFEGGYTPIPLTQGAPA
jgi:hypothetical protein